MCQFLLSVSISLHSARQSNDWMGSTAYECVSMCVFGAHSRQTTSKQLKMCAIRNNFSSRKLCALCLCLSRLMPLTKSDGKNRVSVCGFLWCRWWDCVRCLEFRNSRPQLWKNADIRFLVRMKQQHQQHWKNHTSYSGAYGGLESRFHVVQINGDGWMHEMCSNFFS